MILLLLLLSSSLSLLLLLLLLLFVVFIVIYYYSLLLRFIITIIITIIINIAITECYRWLILLPGGWSHRARIFAFFVAAGHRSRCLFSSLSLSLFLFLVFSLYHLESVISFFAPSRLSFFPSFFPILSALLSVSRYLLASLGRYIQARCFRSYFANEDSLEVGNRKSPSILNSNDQSSRNGSLSARWYAPVRGDTFVFPPEESRRSHVAESIFSLCDWPGDPQRLSALRVSAMEMFRVVLSASRWRDFRSFEEGLLWSRTKPISRRKILWNVIVVRHLISFRFSNLLPIFLRKEKFSFVSISPVFCDHLHRVFFPRRVFVG